MKYLVLFFSIIMSLQVKADVITAIANYLELPYTSYGIILDKVEKGNQALNYDCHIDYDSKTITSFMNAFTDSELADSLKEKLSDHYKSYNPFGEGIDTNKINLFGESLFGNGCPVYIFFKSDMISSVGQYVYAHNLDKELAKPIKINFNIWNTKSTQNPMRKMYHQIIIDATELTEAVNMIKIKCKPFDVEKKKLEMLRGIEMNKNALPIDLGFGSQLVDIERNGYETIYKCSISDFIAEKTSLEDLKSSVRQVKLACETTRDGLGLKECKGFGLLGMKLTYYWFKSSNNEKLASVTFGFPSLQIIDIWPSELADMLSPVAYTEDTETSAIPILLEEVVDLGLGENKMWASCNLGAKNPEENGVYCGFGDGTGLKTSRNSDDYQIPHNLLSYSGILQLDIARSKMGEWWHTPTFDDWHELFDNCLRIETTYKGKRGLKVIGWNGNAIFLPYSGFRDGEKVFEDNESGCYWSSSLTEKRDAQNLYLKNQWVITSYEQKFRGLSIRPIREY